MFEEISPREYENVNAEKYPYLFLENGDIPDRLYKYHDYLIGFTIVFDIVFVDILCIGKRENILSQCKDLLKRKFKVFNYFGFYFHKDYKTKILVERIIKDYSIVNDEIIDDCRAVVIEEREVQNGWSKESG